MDLETSLSSQIFALVNANHKYGTFEADYYTIWYWIELGLVDDL